MSDMCLNITALSIIKAVGISFPSWQLVFLRASFGFLILLPFIWRDRTELQRVSQPYLHLLRVALSAVALTSSYYAITQIPLTLFMTMNFTRPLILMGLCVVILHERVRPHGWLAGAIGLLGVWVALNPESGKLSLGMVAMLVTVVAGSGAVMVTRKLRQSSELQLMTFYTVGLAACTLLPAMVYWQAMTVKHWSLLLAVAVLTQCAQYCFIKAHQKGDIEVLGPLGYSSLLISIAVAILVFAEIPTFETLAGAVIIVIATLVLRSFPRRSVD